jgi:chemotaxis protein MotB
VTNFFICLLKGFAMHFRSAATSCFLVVLLGGCVSQGTYNQEVQQVNTLSDQNKTYQALNQQLQAEIKADQVKIKQLQGRLTVTLVDEIVFSSGSAEMNAKGRATLEKIVGTLQGVTDKRIVVRGYTDNEPIGAALRSRYPTNWELSTARASDVVRFLQGKGIDPTRLEAAGYGEYQPVAPNSSPDGRRQNRRIDIVLTDLNF